MYTSNWVTARKSADSSTYKPPTPTSADSRAMALQKMFFDMGTPAAPTTAASASK